MTISEGEGEELRLFRGFVGKLCFFSLRQKCQNMQIK